MSQARNGGKEEEESIGEIQVSAPDGLKSLREVTFHTMICDDGRMSKVAKNSHVSQGWPVVEPGDHAVTEILARYTGADSPFGEIEFPVDPATLPYVHPVTVINK